MSGKAARIGIVTQRPLSARDRDRFGIPTFLRRGIDVLVADVAELTNPMVDHDRSTEASHAGYEVARARTAAELRDVRDGLADCDVILNFAQGGVVSEHNLPVQRTIAQTGRPSLVNLGNTYPGWDRASEKSTVSDRVKTLGTRLRRMRPRTSILARAPLKILGLREASFAIRGGRDGFYSRFVGPATTRIDAHSFDYDIFLALRAQNLPERDVAVFIDEYRPFHSDLATTGHGKIVDADIYFAELRGLFYRIERETGLSVEIAANPRARYDSMPDIFGDRRIARGETAGMIASARLVLAHRSTAIGFAIMWRKPVLLITTEQNYRHPTQTPYFDGFAAALGKPLQFYENADAVDLSIAFQIDNGCYDAYLERWVKIPGTPQKPLWDIVVDELLTRGALGKNADGEASWVRRKRA